MKSVDAIVVGQGLAGTLMSNVLWKENKSFIVIDQENNSSASRHTSGVMNPITGRRFVKTWMIDELLPFAFDCYSSIEHLLDKKLVFKQDIKKILHSIKELNDLSALASSPEYLPYFKNAQPNFLNSNIFNNPFGYVEIEEAFRVDIQQMLVLYRRFLKEKSLLRENVFDYQKIDFFKSTYEDISFGKIIFCEGYLNTSNPFFSHLPVKPNKGQYLAIDRRNLPIDSTITGAGIISPINETELYAGATYEWSFDTVEATQDGFDLLKKNVDTLLSCPYNILEHRTGIRPTSPDRRPLLGVHSSYPNLAIFNGFGAKGTSLAPYFSQHLYNHLWQETPLLNEVDIKRFA